MVILAYLADMCLSVVWQLVMVSLPLDAYFLANVVHRGVLTSTQMCRGKEEVLGGATPHMRC